MFGWLKTKKNQREMAMTLYTACVKQARLPIFYRNLDIEDTMEGRFEMICLHVSLLMDWLYTTNQHTLAQAVFDVMFKDIDQNLREEGVGDLAIPKRIKKMMKSLKGRALAYQTGRISGDLPATIEKNIGATDPRLITIFVRYIEQSTLHIKQSNLETPETLFLSSQDILNVIECPHE